jgi:hypothetical protein
VNAVRRPPPPVRLPLGIAVDFGVMTACTNAYGCTTVGCRPCATASTGLSVGWAVQGVLLLVAVTLTVLGACSIRLRAVRRAAWLLGPVSIALMALTTVLAVRGY